MQPSVATGDVRKCLASYSVFREIYDKEKDIYDILAEFIIDAVRTAGIHQFASTEVVELLGKRFSFSIPEAVVRNALKRIKGIRREDGVYYIQSLPEKMEEIDKRLADIDKQNEEVIEGLIKAIERNLDRTLSQAEREEAIQAFASFILDKDGASSKYAKTISAYVIKNSENSEFVKKLSFIKEGIILYSGLQYTPEDFSTLKWDHDLVLFLDTDVLFSIGGLNGELKKLLAQDLISLISEVNRKAQRSEKRNRIELRYFKEIEEEMIDFFAAAEHKVAENKTQIEKRPAMIAIMNGCRTKSDVVSKRNAFFSSLRSHSIIKDDYQDYYSEDNYKYYIESEDNAKAIIDDLGKSWGVDDVRYSLLLLSKINILRLGKKPKFEDAKYFLITGNGMYHEIGKHIARTRGHDTQLDTSIEVLTDKLWVKLNKGFGSEKTPKVFSVVTKAQMVLSMQLNISVGAKYEELIEKVKNGTISVESAQLSLSDFRQRIVPAERITSTNVDQMIVFTEQSVEETVQEYEFARIKFQEQTQETEKLRKEITEKNTRLYELEEAERNKKKRKDKVNKVARGILLIGVPATIWVFGLVLMILRASDWISISLGSFGMLTQIMGLLRFFGIDAKIIKAKLKRES